MMNDLTLEEVRVFQDELPEYALKKNPDLLKLIREKRKLEPDIEKGMTELLGSFIQDIVARRKKVTPDKFDDYVDTTQKPEPVIAK
jgi:hypothetical protein